MDYSRSKRLGNHHQFVFRDNKEAALKLAVELFSSVESLEMMPNRGRGGAVSGTRELVLAPLPYIIVYQVFPQTVRVLRIRHASQKWPPDKHEKA